MHEDYRIFLEKGSCRQLNNISDVDERAKHAWATITERQWQERKSEKLRAPITLLGSSIRFTLPPDLNRLERVSALKFLVDYGRTSATRRQVIGTIVRRISRDTVIGGDDAREIIFEYFNGYQSTAAIQGLLEVLEINGERSFSNEQIVAVCCYAERYFLHQRAATEKVVYDRDLQETIDMEYLHRKLDGLCLNESLRCLLTTLKVSQAQRTR
jgi:hypothetical protein